MTAIKVDSKLATHANEALTPHASPLFGRLGSSRLAVVELRSVERTEPAEEEDKEQAVKVRIAHLEVAGADQEETLRGVMRALNAHRTAYGTLTEDEDVQLADSTLERACGEINAVEAARLHVAVDRWTEYLSRALSQTKLTAAGLRSEVDAAIRGLRAAKLGAEKLL